MKKQHLLIATLALTSIILAAVGTAALLSYLDNQEASPAVEQKQEEMPVDNKLEAGIDKEANAQAQAIENTAAGLMESDPSEAQEKYLEAAQAYQAAGNMNKMGEAQANAMTAEILAQQKAQQQP